MIVFAVLLMAHAALHAPGVRSLPLFAGRGDKLAWALGVTLLVAAASHFLSPDTLVAMMPPFLPAPALLVAVSGVAEILIALGLLVRRTRRAAALAAIALFVAVFPANIYAAVSGAPIPSYPESPLYRWVRLPLQFGLMAWAYAVFRDAARPLSQSGRARRPDRVPL